MEEGSAYGCEKEERKIGQAFCCVVGIRVNIKKNGIQAVKEAVENIGQKHVDISFVRDIIVEEIEEEGSYEVVEKS